MGTEHNNSASVQGSSYTQPYHKQTQSNYNGASGLFHLSDE